MSVNGFLTMNRDDTPPQGMGREPAALAPFWNAVLLRETSAGRQRLDGPIPGSRGSR
jgi:hypothetical protein